MKGSNRGNMKEETGSAVKPRIGTRSTGQTNSSSTRSLRALKSPAGSSTTSPSMVAPRRLRSLSPGIKDGKLRPKKAKVEKGQETQKGPKLTDSTSKHASLPSLECSEQGIQTGQTTPKGAGIRTRLSTGSIQMNGTMTISAAKEKAEMDQIIKQIAKSEPGLVTKTPPSNLRKRQSTTTPSEIVSADHPPPKKRKIGRNDGSGEDNCNDYFCWLCHKEGTLVCCELCPRVYHTRCLGLSAELPQDWVCPECEKIMRAECVDTRSKAMEMLTIEQLCTLLKYALERMKHAGSEPFQKPVDISAVPNYSDYIFHPMDLTTLERNIKKKMYGCTEALLADAKWILHNCIIYNGAHHKLTNSAKMIIKICKHEMNEIELCPDCYLNSCVRKDDEWFSDTCRVPHTLVWAKLKGYPFWPSKALREVDGQVDVRFFGAHDRSWVPVSQCFLLSKNIPTSLQKGKKNNGLDMAIEELNLHVNKLREKFGGFEYAPFRTPYDKTDSYKPITSKPELSSKPSTVLRLSQSRESKIGNSSSFSGNKPNILRKSVAKIRNKYSAIVTLKKMDLSPEKGKKKPILDSKCVVEVIDNETVKVKPDTTGNQTAESESEVKTGSGSDEGQDKDLNLESYLKGTKTVEEKGKEKGIKKTFVSSSLIRQIEDKLKGLVQESGKEDVNVGDEVENSAGEKTKTVEISMKPEEVETKLTETIEKTSDAECVKENSESNLKEDEGENKLQGKPSSDSITEVSKQSENLSQEKIVEDTDGCKLSDTNHQAEIVSEEMDDLPKVGTSKTDTESKDSYRKKLDTMIKSCKEKLGMDGEKAVDDDSVISENDEDDDDENDDSSSSSDDDDDDNEYSVESDDNSGESESEETSEEGKEKLEMDTSNADTEKVIDNEKGPEQENSENLLNKELVKDNKTEQTYGTTDKQLSVTAESKETKGDPKRASTEVEKCELDNVNKGMLEDKKIIDDRDKKESDHSESKSAIPDNLSNSVAHGSSENSDPTKGKDIPESVGSDKSKAMDGKSLDALAGELKDDTTGRDDESDTDRLVIDLEKESNKNQSKTIGYNENEKSKKSTLITSPKSETIDIEMELKKVKEVSKNKRLVNDTVPKDIINLTEPNTNSKDKLQGKTQSNEIVEKSQTGDLVEKENSIKLSDRAQSNDSINRRKLKSPDNKAQSVSPVNKVPVSRAQSKSPVNRAQSSSPFKNGPNECMEIDDDEEVHDEFSSESFDMYTNMPSNLDSSIPDKNFVKPPQVDVIEEFPTSSKIAEKFSKKLLEKIQQTVDEMCSEVIKEKSESKTVEMLNQKLKQAQWNYYAELNELKHNFQLTMFEMKSGWESEKEQITKSLTAKFQAEKELAVKEAKKKQWCAQCGKEAIFYCCWNTSYCDYPCQQNHWPQHMHTCLQTNKDKTPSTNTKTSTNTGQGNGVSQTTASVPVSAGTNVTPQTSVTAANQSTEPDHLRRLQDNLTMALQREEEKRGDSRPGVSPKFNPPMSSPIMQNIRQPGPSTGGMMFNMQQQMQPNMMQQIQRNRFPNQQQMAMQVQQRSSLPQSQQQQGNPRMLFSQPLIQQTIYPLQVQPQQQLAQQQLGGTLLFQNAQPNLMTYGMPPRPY